MHRGLARQLTRTHVGRTAMLSVVRCCCSVPVWIYSRHLRAPATHRHHTQNMPIPWFNVASSPKEPTPIVLLQQERQSVDRRLCMRLTSQHSFPHLLTSHSSLWENGTIGLLLSRLFLSIFKEPPRGTPSAHTRVCRHVLLRPSGCKMQSGGSSIAGPWNHDE